MKIRIGSKAGVMLALALVVSTWSVASARAAGHDGVAVQGGATASQMALREAMRKLWSDHVFWTREYVIAAIDGTSDAQAAAARLLRNQDDIGAAIAPYYGKPAGDKLASLLRQHILIAIDLVAAAKSNDQAKFQANDAKWKQNAGDIAGFLSQANSNWPREALTEAMNMHLSTTTREVVDRLQKNYDDDVRAFDAIYDHILHMADVLADGIIRQFPARFAN
jgi:hypothetical protein